MTQWIHNWKRNGWRTSDRKPVKNEDLWRRLDAAAERHTIEWRWIKGHAGHEMNERADELARQGIGAVPPAEEEGGRVGPRSQRSAFRRTSSRSANSAASCRV